MILNVPKIIEAVLKVGFAKLANDQLYRETFNNNFGTLTPTFKRFADEATAYDVSLENYFDTASMLNTWIAQNEISIKIGYPRMFKTTEQITISYGQDSDDPNIMMDYAGHKITEDAPPGSNIFRQWLKLAQIESRQNIIHITSTNADINWYVTEAIKSILRTNRHNIAGFGIKNFTLSTQDIEQPDTDTGVHIFHRIISFKATVNNTYENVPYDIGDDNRAPSEIEITGEPKDIDSEGNVELGES